MGLLQFEEYCDSHHTPLEMSDFGTDGTYANYLVNILRNPSLVGVRKAVKQWPRVILPNENLDFIFVDARSDVYLGVLEVNGCGRQSPAMDLRRAYLSIERSFSVIPTSLTLVKGLNHKIERVNPPVRELIRQANQHYRRSA